MAQVFFRGLAADRAMPAYILVGDPRQAGRELARLIVQYVYCTAAQRPCGECPACAQAAAFVHADLRYFEPESKSRRITIDNAREAIHFLHLTAFAGGWKTAVLMGADRLTEEAQNALLKVLEEPPYRSLLLLVTQNPEALLPTIRSRCHRLVVPEAAAAPTGEWVPALAAILGDPAFNDPIRRLALVGQLEKLIADQLKKLDDSKDGPDTTEPDDADESGEDTNPDEPAADNPMADDKEVRLARAEARRRQLLADLMRAILLWQRDVAVLAHGGDEKLLYYAQHLDALRRQASGLSGSQAVQRMQAVETMHRRLERLAKATTTVLDAGLRDILAGPA